MRIGSSVTLKYHDELTTTHMATETVETQAGGNKFAQALARKALVFEPRPLRDIKDPGVVQVKARELHERLKGIQRLDAINVPEIIEENHVGQPKYSGGYEREYVSAAARLLDREAIVNKVVVHLKTHVEFKEWLLGAHAMGINNFVFVGGNERHRVYPGPTVSEANVAARHITASSGQNDILVGNIVLPQRRGEARQRMIYKSLSGAQFFTTQVIFTSDVIIDLLASYHKQCEEVGIQPRPVLLSFAPLLDRADKDLLDWLKADVPDKVADFILANGTPPDPTRNSVLNALRIYAEIVSALDDRKVEMPLGVNVEQISGHNLVAAIKMLKAFERIIDLPWSEFRIAPPVLPQQVEKRVSDILE
jgi:5,10-methylenetetrahydrofolate reductase